MSIISGLHSTVNTIQLNEGFLELKRDRHLHVRHAHTTIFMSITYKIYVEKKSVSKFEFSRLFCKVCNTITQLQNKEKKSRKRNTLIL